MKILYINSVYGYGSTGKIVRKLRDEAIRAGHEAYVIYGRRGAVGYKGSTVSEENVWLMENSLEQKVDIASSVLFDSHGLHCRKNTERIIGKIREIQPDLIHMHNIHGFYVNYPMLFAFLKEYQKPVVWTLHDCWAFTGFCSHYTYNGCGKWKEGCTDCRFRNVYPYRIISSARRNYELKKKAYKGTNLILVTPSAWLKNEIKESMLGIYPCRVIYNDVSLEDFRYDPGNTVSEYHLEGKRIYLSAANVWTPQKGYEECLKLAEILDPDEVLVMVGLSEKQMRKLPDKILGIPHCDASQLRNWYSACDAFFNPTLEDTYPTVNLEAAACGAPVVTYNTGGSPESAGAHGVTVERYDINAAHEQLKIADRNLIIEETEKKPMAAEYLRLYEQAAGVKR